MRKKKFKNSSKKADAHIDFRRSPFWNPRIKILRQNLINNPGAGEKQMAQALEELKFLFGQEFNYIKQWPVFISLSPIAYKLITDGDEHQVFFIDFLLKKLKICIEVDGANHSELTQENWDNWRSDLIRKEGYFILRYSTSQILSNIAEVKADLVKKLKSLDTKVSQESILAMMICVYHRCFGEVNSKLETPIKFRGRRKVKKTVLRANLSNFKVKCKRCKRIFDKTKFYEKEMLFLKAKNLKDWHCETCTNKLIQSMD